MTELVQWNMGKCLEWYTQVPFPNQDRWSPIFLFQDNKCCFYFRRGSKNNDASSYVYNLSFERQTTTQHELKPFPLVIYSDHITTNKLSRSDTNVYKFGQNVLSIDETIIINKRKGNLTSSCSCFIRFFFIFGNGVGPLLNLETKTEEKSSQTDLRSSVQTDTECLSLDFDKLLETGNHSDVQLQCNGGNVPAHRAILAARSKEFFDMFQDSSSESQTGLVNFTTTEVSVMKLCLEFIYTGKISDMPAEMALNLYVLGHALKIPSLSKVCADLMISDVSQDNYISNLVLADKYDDDYLKSKLIDYISHHADLLKSKN